MPFIVGFISSICSVFLFSGYLISIGKWPHQLPADQFGNLVSGLAATLAFIWIVVTAHLQRVDLELQRKELQRNTEAQALQAAELAKAAQLQAENVRVQERNILLQREMYARDDIEKRLLSIVEYWREKTIIHNLHVRGSNIQLFPGASTSIEWFLLEAGALLSSQYSELERSRARPHLPYHTDDFGQAVETLEQLHSQLASIFRDIGRLSPDVLSRFDNRFKLSKLRSTIELYISILK